MEGAAVPDAGVVDEQVDLEAAPHDLRVEPPGAGRIGEVGRHHLDRRGSELPRQRAEPFFPARDQHQPAAAGREGARVRLADAGGRAGDEGEAPVEDAVSHR